MNLRELIQDLSRLAGEVGGDVPVVVIAGRGLRPIRSVRPSTHGARIYLEKPEKIPLTNGEGYLGVKTLE